MVARWKGGRPTGQASNTFFSILLEQGPTCSYEHRKFPHILWKRIVEMIEYDENRKIRV